MVKQTHVINPCCNIRVYIFNSAWFWLARRLLCHFDRVALNFIQICSRKYGYAVKAIYTQRAFFVEFIDLRLRINTDFTLSLHQKKEIDYQLDKECVC